MNFISKKSRAWIELNFNNLKHNVSEFKRIIPKNTSIMAVVKANAYGHGIVPISLFLNSIGINNFAVATLEEGILMRENGITGNILIFGYTPLNELNYVLKYDLIQTIVDFNYAKSIETLNLNTKLNVHLKINTGLNRLGEKYNSKNILKFFDMKNLNILGVYSHFAVADSFKKDDILFTKKQITNFDFCINSIKKAGFNPGKIHLQNTYGTLNYNYLNYDFVRIGIGLYGLYNNISHINNSHSNIDLYPVLSLKACITSIKKIEKNDTVSYGRNFISNQTKKIATVSIGYADGYSRKLSNKNTKVLINEQFVNVIGTICMDQLIIDISNIANVSVGDIVTLVGNLNDISVENLSYNSNSISNEFVCRFSERLPRTF